ncbi:MAG: DNA adenine methylase [Myxococcota bacterium]
MIKYIGSKRTLIPQIVRAVKGFGDVRSVLDLFSGTSRVGHALKRAGFEVTGNDHLSFASVLARCYVEADASHVEAEARELLSELQNTPAKRGYFTETFCEQARYFQPHNGARVDAIREAIAAKNLPRNLEAIALTSLMEAADRVDSTTGVQMAYLKQWASRSHKEISLRLPEVLPGKGRALQLEAMEAAASTPVDLVYLDPPYNQHSYLGNYHIWETLVRWDKPDFYGVACKRVACRDYKSPFNSKKRIVSALESIIRVLSAQHLVVSFNNEGFINREEMEEILGTFGRVRTVEIDFKRYVGAQIGVYSPSGKKVGSVSHLRNKELLYLVSKNEGAVQSAFTQLTAAS